MSLPSILVGDDSPSLRRMIGACLRAGGFEVTEAADGDQAHALAVAGNFGMLVTDQVMPGMDGLTLIRSLRATPRYARMPILMLTAADRLDDKASGFELGADDYLTKPFELRELVLRLRALDRRSAHNRPPVREIAGLRLDPVRRGRPRGGTHPAAGPRSLAPVAWCGPACGRAL